MPRGLNGTHRELSLTEAVASDIWRPPALQAREDPIPTALAVLSAFLKLTPAVVVIGDDSFALTGAAAWQKALLRAA